MIGIPSPQDKKYTQTNRSDMIGNIYVTKNISFDKEGYVQLSNATPSFYSEEDDIELETATVFCECDDYGFFVQTRDENFQIDEVRPYAIEPSKILTAGVPAGDIEGDATFFGDFMVVSQDTDVDYYSPSANTWTDTNISLDGTNDGQHPVVHFVSLNALAIGDLNNVYLYEYPFTATPTGFSSGGVTSNLTLPSHLYVTGMTYFNDNLYVGTWNQQGSKACLYVWDGTGTAAQSVFEVDSRMIFDVETYMDSVVVCTGAGELLRFNGSGFTQLGALPIFFDDLNIADFQNLDNYKNSLKANNDVLYWAFNSDATTWKNNNQADGVWCYDPSVGFYHRYAFSTSKAVHDSLFTADISTADDQITLSATPITGTEVLYYQQTNLIGGLENGVKYYIIKVDGTTAKLATTLANANAGTAIDLTSTGSASGHKFVWVVRTDFGQKYLERGGCIMPFIRVMDEPWFGTDLLWGGDAHNRANTTKSWVGSTSTAFQNRGYFITAKVFSQAGTDTFNNVNLKFSPFKDEADEIIIKYRTVDDRKDNQFVGLADHWLGTWTSTTTFTTTDASFADVAVGDEVEFVKGGGSGYIAHITTISENSGTYTVTLDDTYDYYESGDIGFFQTRNWKKWKTISYNSSNANKYFISEQLGAEGKFIQFKIELRGVGVRVEELLVDNVVLLSAR